MEGPRSFISYAWESNELKDWVRMLAERLVENGVKTSLDQWDIQLGSDLPEYMETCVRQSDFVILVCTPTFSAKATAGEGGVGYERRIVSGEIYQGVASPNKFVPILRRGNPKESLPSYLKSKYYIDFRDDNEFDSKLEELLRHVYQYPKYTRPPLGKQPNFSTQGNRPLQVEHQIPLSAHHVQPQSIIELYARPNSSIEIKPKGGVINGKEK